MRSTMARATIIGVLLAVATLVLIVYSAVTSYSVLCEVCVTFNGRTSCREAYGNTREEAIRTATDNACALISGGMTDGIRCSNTPPDEVTCE